jgi:hypothetical protein
MPKISTPRLRELLALAKVYNDHDLIGNTKNKVPYISYRNAVARSMISAAWLVVSPGYRTDPDGSYRDGFNKVFPVTGDVRARVNRDTAQQAAKVWAEKRYGVTHWVKTPFGGWTSRVHLDERLRQLLPKEFDPNYRDPTVQRVVKKMYGDDPHRDVNEPRFFRVVIQLYAKPEPPVYVRATDEDDARRQMTQLFTRVAGTRVLDGLKLYVYDVED